MSLGVYFILTPNTIYQFLDHDNQKLELGTNYNDTVEDINISFIFYEKNIDQYYKYHDNSKENRAFINLFSDDITANGTLEYRYVYVNDCLYNNFTKAHQTSLILDKNCLNEFNQELRINKNTTLTIDKVELEYFGTNSTNTEFYRNLVFFIGLVLIVVGVTIVIMDIYS